MATVWILPPGTDDTAPAAPGDDLLRPGDGDVVEVGKQDSNCTWIGSLSASLLPALPQVDLPTEAPEQAVVLQAVQGVESAETHRGG